MNDTPHPPKDQSQVRQARLRDALRANLKKRRAQLRGRAAAGGDGDVQDLGGEPAQMPTEASSGTGS